MVSRLAGRAGLRVGGGRGRERDRLRGRGVRAGCARAGCSGAGADVGAGAGRRCWSDNRTRLRPRLGLAALVAGL